MQVPSPDLQGLDELMLHSPGFHGETFWSGAIVLTLLKFSPKDPPEHSCTDHLVRTSLGHLSLSFTSSEKRGDLSMPKEGSRLVQVGRT